VGCCFGVESVTETDRDSAARVFDVRDQAAADPLVYGPVGDIAAEVLDDLPDGEARVEVEVDVGVVEVVHARTPKWFEGRTWEEPARWRAQGHFFEAIGHPLTMFRPSATTRCEPAVVGVFTVTELYVTRSPPLVPRWCPSLWRRAR
jgi:hypothetical protein